MEDLYDVLVEIRDELANIKEELRAIRGVGGYSKDLDDIHSKLADIEDAIKYNS
ncbi:MAG: hypothetical protein IKV26_01270 [Paludibacteraceae bacterium]|nr:hypothetical protein [Paludibacteraceae bacterium]